MGWLVLSGDTSTSSYDGELQIIRHDGASGETYSFPWTSNYSVISSGARITWADPYVYVTNNYMAATGLTTIDRVSLATWPPSSSSIAFYTAGAPGLLSGVFKFGSTYYALGGNFAGGATPYVALSSDGLSFYPRESLLDLDENLDPLMVRGENGRFVFSTKDNLESVYLYYTDDFIDIISVNFSEFGRTGYNSTIKGCAGSSAGVWALVVSYGGTFISTDNLATFSYLGSLEFHRVWAYGTTLYGAINGRIYSSTDGTNWTDKGLPFGNVSIEILDLTYDGTSEFLLVGELGYAVTTTNFSTYTALSGYNFAGHALFSAIYVADEVLYPTPAAAPVFTLFTLPDATVDVPYTTTLGSVANGVLPIVWSGSVTSPGGAVVYSITSTTLSHTFTALGEYAVAVTVTDDLGRTSVDTTTLLVTDGGGTTGLTLVVTNPLPSASVGIPYSTPVGAAGGGTPPYVWAITTKSWADSAAISSLGVLTTTFTAAGAETLTVSVTDSSTPAQVLSRNTAITVAENPYTATIEGTLRLDTSDGDFAARKVYLYDYTTGNKIAETTSDGTTGEWSFTAVAPGEYFVVGAAQGDDLNIPRDFDAMGVITVA